MFDFKFDWCKEMEGGVELIDEQHQSLFRIGRDMEQLIMSGCQNASTQQLLDIVCELRDYVAYHFYAEEGLMQQYDYPNLAEHKKVHDIFKRRVLLIDPPTLGKYPEKILPKLKDDLQDFVFKHMLIEDRNLCKYLNTCGLS